MVRSSAEIKSYLEVKLHHFLFPSNVARGGENFFRTSRLFIYKLNLYTPSQPYFVHFGLLQRQRCKQVACLNQQKRKQHYQACFSEECVTCFSPETPTPCVNHMLPCAATAHTSRVFRGVERAKCCKDPS